MKNLFKNIIKSMWWVSVAFTIVGVLNLILFVILSSTGVVTVRSMAYLFAIGYIAIVWVPWLISLIFKAKFDIFFLITFHIYMYLGICAGSLWGVYSMGFGFDKIVHVVGGLMLALLGYEIFVNCKNNKLSLFWVFVLMLSFSMMCGGVWEIYEFLTDGMLNNNAQVWMGFVGRDALKDTMYDLICDFGGAAVGGAIAVYDQWSKAKKESLPESETNADSSPKSKNAK